MAASIPTSLLKALMLAVAACTFAAAAVKDNSMPPVTDYPPVSDLKPNPDLPDPFMTLSGKLVTSKQQWEKERRPELKRLFQHYMYGYMPAPPKNVRGTVEREDRQALGGKATLREVTIRFGPDGTPPIHLLEVIPNKRSKPAPVFVGVAFCGPQAVLPDPNIRISDTWMFRGPGVVDNRATEASRGSAVDVWNVEQTIDRGYAVAIFYNGDVDPDKPDFTDGVHPHFLRSGKTQHDPQDWGTIAAWAWGAHRVVDYLVTDKDIDRKRIAVVGHSRNGKASLVAAAFDERIALAIPHQAGCGGTAPSRGKVGESVTRINTSFPHWFNSTFKQFNDRPELLPFDQHELVALVAPRPVLFSNAAEDEWANPNGQFEVLRAADKVYRFLGVEGLEAQQVPPMGKLVDSRLGYFIRPGKHSMTTEDWRAFLDFADRHFGVKR
jgi:hypothetical protein